MKVMGPSVRDTPNMVAGMPYSVLWVSSEVVGFAKTGGLADVCGSLPAALARRGHRQAVVMPLYRGVLMGKRPVELITAYTLQVPFDGKLVPTRVWRSTLPRSEVPVYLIENEAFFQRDDPASGRTIYQFTDAKGCKQDYEDNGERYLFLCRAALELVPHLPSPPDIIHANDWQAGLVPILLREAYAAQATYRRIRTLFTIHNMAYQGLFDPSLFPKTGLSWRLFNHHQIEFYGRLNCLKAGVVFADWINTVSPTYSQEIRTTYFGCGLDGVLTERRDRLSGIVNGVDYSSWSPTTDLLIPVSYDTGTFEVGKAAAKAELQRRMNLDPMPNVPLFGMVARLVEQKGVDLAIRAADSLLLHDDIQIAVLGDGDPEYHHKLEQLQAKHPGRVGMYLGFDESLAHLVEAGSDFYLMPSLFEPSGLNQLYSLRYGTPPVVRATGGLADTITDTNDDTLRRGVATGFRFQAYTPAALAGAMSRAIGFYRERPEQLREVILTGMNQDWSWDRSAVEYEELYRKLVAERESRYSSPPLSQLAGR